ncbi:MAG: hypothetical protein COX62_02505 [Deltaproteobacteria bacterium CG_4_10_14_0_2_um_filter_43_8]|nr:MAG: hypothetical protein COV43_00450 [Deltaproteobacteria bacterium CG11_big_fil_rev_8_21_14_0_20_42_23]PJA21415.1 MAG: hypothetical protein COX62_02505 [Deltaproteobacteria bacterium CG_4_10_14_0_2_um_filter_43_8]PJC64695.1 MAG: hypothetical protein CO021_02920 [Deltaproteobacteria bacterium CG_4_9_14_0_2_um_filter_42_21]
MQTKPFKIGIIGAGRIARVHALALRALPLLEIKAVTNRSFSNAQTFCADFNIPVCASSVQDLCDDPQIDAVHICNVNTAHLEAIRIATKNGKAILCEKPLVHHQSVLSELSQISTASSSLFSVCFSFRYHPTALMLMQRLPEVGKIKKVDISYLQSSWLKKRKDAWRPDPLVYGNSYVLADIGSHTLDMARHLLHQQLFVEKACIHYDGKVAECSDIEAELELLSENKIPVSVKLSKAAKGFSNRMSIRVVGEYGELGTDDVLSGKIYFSKENEKIWIQRAPHLEGDVLQFPEEHPEGWLSGFVNLFHLFYQSLGKNSPLLPLPTVKESIQISRCIGDVLEQAVWKPL